MMIQNAGESGADGDSRLSVGVLDAPSIAFKDEVNKLFNKVVPKDFKEGMKIVRIKRNAYLQTYRQRPEVREKKRGYNKKYRQKPEVKKQIRKSNRARYLRLKEARKTMEGK